MKLLCIVFSIFMGSAASANQFGIVGGLNMAGGDADLGDGTKVDLDRELGFNIGGRYNVDLNGFSLRTGFQLSQYTPSAKGTVDFEGTNVNYKFDYTVLQLMVPVTASFNVNQNFKIFGGAGISLNLDDEVKGTISAGGLSETVSEEAEAESIWLTLQVGAAVMLNENAGLEFVFDYGLNDFAENVEINVLALNFVYML